MENKKQKLDAQERQWKCEDDLRVLKNAVEILKDQERLQDVQDSIQEQKTLLETVEKIDANYLESIGFKPA